ncbi:DUF7008 domain-containing protein [Streptomyces tropicalis]|uniref:DUF7008 domain-containing protein n=1 Tax=Streptomyces tropicalis TaxID=3034234 RepID=UPI003F68AADF
MGAAAAYRGPPGRRSLRCTGQPKERFICYPGTSPEADGSLLLGWAGWNHSDPADALVSLIRDRVETDGWAKEDPRFVPLLAGLREVMPWVHQWYGEYDEESEGNPAEEFQAALGSGRAEREPSESDLVNRRAPREEDSRPPEEERVPLPAGASEGRQGAKRLLTAPRAHQPRTARLTNAVHLAAETLSTAPPGRFESRTYTRGPAVATSTH